MRRPRIKADGAGYYHCMSRFIERRHQAAEALKARFTYRMYEVSEFFKALKQRFSQYYNTREDRSGPLWEQRFKSILVERSEQALSTMAAYIDLNPVRAGLVSDPKDYRYSGYGELCTLRSLRLQAVSRG